MNESEEITRRGVRIRVVLDAAEVHRSESVTGNIAVQVAEPSRRWVPEVRVALRGGTALGSVRSRVEQIVVNRHRPDSDEVKRFPFSLQVPASTLLGSAQLELTFGGGISRWMPALRLALTVVPERYFVEVAELIGSLSGHWISSWATSATGDGVYVQLVPRPAVQDRVSGITVGLRTVGLHLQGTLTLNTISFKTWLEPDVTPVELAFETSLVGLTTLEVNLAPLKAKLEPFLRQYTGTEHDLPIPSRPEAAPDGLPIAVS
jgi:hypothetical protein